MPRIVEEWAKGCRGRTHPETTLPFTILCLDCARAYAAEQVAQARAEEREACAKLCEGEGVGETPDTWGWHSKDYARAIRARRDEG
jgi:hypothetical protein